MQKLDPFVGSVQNESRQIAFLLAWLMDHRSNVIPFTTQFLLDRRAAADILLTSPFLISNDTLPGLGQTLFEKYL